MNRERATRRPQLWLRLALLACLSFGGCGVRTAHMPSAARKESWEVFFNRGDAVAVAGLYSENAELVMSGAPPIHGREAILAAVTRMMQSGVKVRVKIERSAAAGDLAYFFGPYTVSRQQKVVERGSYLEVWHRYGARWLIDLDVNATGAPIAASPAQ